jgi:hypothetical protein
MDKEGTLAAEQILLLKAYNAMIVCGSVVGEDTEKYSEKYEQLERNLMTYFWDEEKGAFIDSYESGKRHVTRHANIFAVLFDFVDKLKAEKILQNVLLNDKITQITTPYFKFFEQDALCKLGQTDRVFNIICDYWGGMVQQDAVTFWEEYIPDEKGNAVYEMYGDPFGKSLCHAWGASPIYLLGRYFAGIRPTSPGYQTFSVEPKLECFSAIDCTFPIKGGSIRIKKEANTLVVCSTKEGGTMSLNGTDVVLKANMEYAFDLPKELVGNSY